MDNIIVPQSTTKQPISQIKISDNDYRDLNAKYWNGYEVLKSINGESLFGEGDINSMIKVLYSNLKELRNDSQLIPGQQYRIIDYVTTTSQEDTQSAGHQFDIIVTALDESTLSEEAKAIQNDNDDYFDSCNLSAWKIWYSLDNDSSKFEWIDTENGKGVIYRMIDEWGNDCPYDFKNIMFKRWLYSDGAGVADEDSGDFDAYCYTFSWEDRENGIMDASIFGNNGYLLNDEAQIGGVYGNIIGVYNSYEGDETPQSTKQYLNDIVFFSTYGYDECYYGCYSNTFGNNCYSNTFGNSCYSNTFGNSCYSNIFGNYCYSNIFGNYCLSNNFGNDCYSNTFGNNCYSNTFGNYCYSNTFGNSCYSNTFGNNCYSNTFGNDCYSNKFGNDCYSNKFGIFCYSNNFGNDCYSNTFGNDCYSNTFGNNCYSNKFGIFCCLNTFGNGCCSNTFGNTDYIKSYYRYIIFDNGNSYIRLNCTATISSLKYYQNVRIGLGVNNTTTYKNISDGNVGQLYETYYKPADSQVILI